MFKTGLVLLSEFILEQLRNELIGQDHVASGDLVDSMRAVVTDNSISIVANDYAKYVDQGQPRGTWVSLEALAKWVEIKGIASGEKEIKNAAFAIRNAIYREGTPTRGSYQFSKNGRRKDFIQVVLDENLEAITEKLTEIFSKEFEIAIFKHAKKVNAS